MGPLAAFADKNTPSPLAGEGGVRGALRDGKKTRLKNYSSFLAFCFCALSLPALAAVPSLKGREPFVPGEIIVRFKEGTSDTHRAKALSVGAARSLKHPDFFKIKLMPGADVQTAIQQAQTDPSVQYAQPNYRYYALGVTCALPSDVYDSGYTTVASWPFLKIQMDKAVTSFSGWASCPPGSSSVTVAVLDSGISRNHPDLRGVPLIGYNAIPTGEQDPSCNSCAYYNSPVTDSAGCTASMDDFGHGTYVAGIIGASWDVPPGNSEVSCVSVAQTTGIAGLAPGCVL